MTNLGSHLKLLNAMASGGEITMSFLNLLLGRAEWAVLLAVLAVCNIALYWYYEQRT